MNTQPAQKAEEFNPEEMMPEGVKLNMGCGHNHMKGFVNVDKFAECSPDEVVDLEQFPWPWENGSVGEVNFNHVLEHLGEARDTYLKIWQELYRVCKPGAMIIIAVPHPRHNDFIDDPTHVRIVTPRSLTLFDQELNLQWAEAGAANTTLGLYLGIDFVLAFAKANPSQEFMEKWKGQEKEMQERVFAKEMTFFNNISNEVRMAVGVRKPPFSEQAKATDAGLTEEKGL